jgi:hypothetical protein
LKKDHLEIILEDIRGKFELVLEGHDVLHKEIRDTRVELCEKISLVDFKVDALSQRVDELDRKVDGMGKSLTQKIDAVAADLKAHRTDTEAHSPVFRVKE